MPDRPILMSAPMVRATLREIEEPGSGKTNTRRALKTAVPPMPALDNIHPNHATKHALPYLDAYCGERKTPDNPRGMGDLWCWWTRDDRPGEQFRVGYRPGDRLYVRETWMPHSLYAGMKPREMPPSKIFFAADNAYAPSNTPWRPNLHMPRWAGRLTLHVTDVRVERLQSISEADARAEGVEQVCSEPGAFNPLGTWRNYLPASTDECSDPIDSFRTLWDSLAKPGQRWADNPWVAVISYRPELRNIDLLPHTGAQEG